MNKKFLVLLFSSIIGSISMNITVLAAPNFPAIAEVLEKQCAKDPAAQKLAKQLKDFISLTNKKDIGVSLTAAPIPQTTRTFCLTKFKEFADHSKSDKNVTFTGIIRLLKTHCSNNPEAKTIADELQSLLDLILLVNAGFKSDKAPNAEETAAYCKKFEGYDKTTTPTPAKK